MKEIYKMVYGSHAYGYAASEKSRLTKLGGITGEKRRQVILEHGYNLKSATNIIRLLREASELLSEGSLQMPLRNIQVYRDIRKAKLSLKEFLELYNEEYRNLDKAFKKTQLKDNPDFEIIDDLMQEIILSQQD